MQVHAINISKIFQNLGYSVVFVSFNGWVPGMDEEVFQTPKGERFHCHYTIARPLKNDIYRKWYRRYHSLSGEMHYKNILRLISIYKPHLIIHYGYISLSQLILYSKKNGIPLLVERTDWFESNHFKDLYSRLIWSKYTDRCIRYWSTLASGMIAISPFFYDYYKEKLPTVLIPALCDLPSDIDLEKDENNRGIFRLVYTGTPGNKDLLQPVINAVSEINKDRPSIRFDIVGIKEYGDLSGKEAEEMGVFFHGKLSHIEALRFVAQSDCSVLLRRNERYAKAGFSTKFSESMMLGVPVLCTDVGGADTCIADNENGFLIADNDVDTIRTKLEYIVDMDSDCLNTIKTNAALYGQEHFNYKSYVSKMDKFLNVKMKVSLDEKTK